MEVAAAKATELPSEGRARQNARKAASQTVRMGERNLSSTLWKKFGWWGCQLDFNVRTGEKGKRGHTIPPSREKANIIREFEVMEKSPQCQTQIMIRHIKITAPSSPQQSAKIWRTGCPKVPPVTVLSKSWIENRKLKITKKPNREENPTDEMTPIGADHEALRVSSDRCAEASNPVRVYWLMRAPQHATYAGEARILHPGSGEMPVPS